MSESAFTCFSLFNFTHYISMALAACTQEAAFDSGTSLGREERGKSVVSSGGHDRDVGV